MLLYYSYLIPLSPPRQVKVPLTFIALPFLTMEVSTIDPRSAAFVCVAISIPLLILQLGISYKKEGSVPDAKGAVPLLGNALQYKDDPTGCIRDQEKRTGSKVFRLNLAGRKIVIVGSCPETMKYVATQPESILSSCRAVAEIGFEYTLGHFNVYKGTAWHKAILKNYVMGDKFQTIFLPGMFHALCHAVGEETKQLAKGGDPPLGFFCGTDFFAFARRCVLRATLDEFVSPLLLQKDPQLLEAFMIFQDMVEDTTAKAAVLPRLVALPSCLWPTEKARKVIQLRISRLLQAIWEDTSSKESSTMGPWSKTYVEEETPPELAAEHVVGLLFASHKNPSIGAAQSLCFLRSELCADQQKQAEQEATALCTAFTLSDGNSSLLTALLEAKTLRACVLETMRLTSHTLGAVRYAEKAIDLPSPKKSKPIHIAKGETISLAHHTMHMEPSIWGEAPTKFSLDRPEWKEKTNQQHGIGIPVDPYKLTTFSNGLHKCPGEKVALAMMQMLLALLLTKDTRLVGKLPPVSFERATLAQREREVLFRIQQ
jgi:cytochrome P450